MKIKEIIIVALINIIIMIAFGYLITLYEEVIETDNAYYNSIKLLCWCLGFLVGSFTAIIVTYRSSPSQ